MKTYSFLSGGLSVVSDTVRRTALCIQESRFTTVESIVDSNIAFPWKKKLGIPMTSTTFRGSMVLNHFKFKGTKHQIKKALNAMVDNMCEVMDGFEKQKRSADNVKDK